MMDLLQVAHKRIKNFQRKMKAYGKTKEKLRIAERALRRIMNKRAEYKETAEDVKGMMRLYAEQAYHDIKKIT